MAGRHMIRSASVLVIFVCTSAALAQSIQRTVFFTGEPDCGYKNKPGQPAVTTRCSTISTTRGSVSAVEQEGVTLSIAYSEERNYIIVAARIANSTNEPVMFDSDLWGAAHFGSRTDFSSGKPPLLAETALPTRDIIRAMSPSAKINESVDSLIAENEKSSVVKEVRQVDGTRVKTIVIVPDEAARNVAKNASAVRSEKVTDEQRKIRENALTAKYVPANGSVKGLVYFRRVKNAEFVVLSLVVGDTRFVFRYPRKPA